MTLRHDRDVATIGLLAGTLAVAVPQALEAVDARLARLDGYPAGGSDEPAVRSSSATTTVERALLARELLWERRNTLTTARNAFIAAGYALQRAADDCQRFAVDDNPAPAIVMCRDTQATREGSIEWGDPLCPMPADKAGLCSSHYWKSYRWRTEHGRRVDHEFQPARATGNA